MDHAHLPPADLELSTVHVNGKTLLVFSYTVAPVQHPVVTTLTVAEQEVLSLVQQGMSDKQIREVRGTSRGTITKQIQSVFRKLGVSSRRELIASVR